MTLYQEAPATTKLGDDGKSLVLTESVLIDPVALYIDRAALEDFFSSPTLLIFQQGAFDVLIEQLPRSIAVFEIDSALVIRAWRVPAAGQLLPLAGIPVHCGAFVLNAGQRLLAEALTGFWTQHNPVSIPAVLWNTFPGADSPALVFRMMQAISDDHCSALRQWSESQRQLAYLRQKNEWLSLQLAKAKALLDDRGESSSLVSCLPPGSRTIGPQGDIACMRCQQLLPAPVAGIRRIALYAIVSDTTNKGRLFAEIVRSGNRQPIARWSVSYEQLRSGWFSLALPRSAEGVHGDCLLRVSWTGKHPGAVPLLAVADSYNATISQGDASFPSVSLALMMWNGVGTSTQDSVCQDDSRPFPESCYEVLSLKSIEARAVFATGSEHQARVTAALNTKPWQVCGEEYVFLHPAVREICAIAIPDCPRPGTRAVQASVVTAHSEAPRTAYTLMAWRESLPISEESLRYWVELTDQAGSRLQAPQVTAVTVVLAPQQRRWITLELDEHDPRPMHLVLAVRSMSDTVDFAWCRWYDLSLKIAFPTDVIDVASTHSVSPEFVA